MDFWYYEVYNPDMALLIHRPPSLNKCHLLIDFWTCFWNEQTIRDKIAQHEWLFERSDRQETHVRD
jgi:hypothetical protein